MEDLIKMICIIVCYVILLVSPIVGWFYGNKKAKSDLLNEDIKKYIYTSDKEYIKRERGNYAIIAIGYGCIVFLIFLAVFALAIAIWHCMTL